MKKSKGNLVKHLFSDLLNGIYMQKLFCAIFFVPKLLLGCNVDYIDLEMIEK